MVSWYYDDMMEGATSYHGVIMMDGDGGIMILLWWAHMFCHRRYCITVIVCFVVYHYHYFCLSLSSCILKEQTFVCFHISHFLTRSRSHVIVLIPRRPTCLLGISATTCGQAFFWGPPCNKIVNPRERIFLFFNQNLTHVKKTNIWGRNH